MANSYKIQLTPSDDKLTRDVVISQWYQAVALAMKSKYGGLVPTTGGYLIDCTMDTDRPTIGCVNVAWLANAVANV